jgi:hypothetical protein
VPQGLSADLIATLDGYTRVEVDALGLESQRRAAAAIPAIFAGAAPSAAAAQAQQRWPTSPIRFVVAFPPGGPTDIVGRIVAAKIAEQQRWTVVVENKVFNVLCTKHAHAFDVDPDGCAICVDYNFNDSWASYVD